MALRHLHVLPVKALGLVPPRQAREHHRNLYGFRQRRRFRNQLIGGVPPPVAAGGEGQAGHGVHGVGDAGGVDVAGARPLEAQLLCHVADKGHGLALLQRQDAPLVFQQHRTLLGGAGGQGMVGVVVAM